MDLDVKVQPERGWIVVAGTLSVRSAAESASGITLSLSQAISLDEAVAFMRLTADTGPTRR